MNQNFLHRVAEDIYSRKGDDISKCIFIFPNKRPEEYLQQELAKLISKPVAAPKMLSIEEFIYSKSDLQQADSLQLIFMLYKVYVKYLPEEDFEKFYAWGNMLLKDFDEIDRYMAQADKLFSHLMAIKEIENSFLPGNPEDFTNHFIDENEPDFLQKRFIFLWEVYRAIYTDFQKYLIERKLAYPGMAYREVAENYLNNNFESDDLYYVFVGFNALSTAEETIIKTLTKNGNGSIFWDADIYYLENEREEAGHFIREAIKKLPPPQGWQFDDRLKSGEKNIHIIGVPLKVGQAKALGVEVKKHFSAKAYMENSAIVLPDENMLLPVMHAFPHHDVKIHSTSGYPLTNSALYALLELLFSLQENFVFEKQAFYFKDVLAVLNHPLLRCRNHNHTKKIIELINKNEWVYAEKAEIEKYFDCEIIKIIFSETSDTQKLINYILAIVQNIEKETPGLNSAEFIMLSEVKNIIQQLENLLHTQEIHLQRNTFLRLFREAAAQKRIPMAAGAQNAVQLMGMLETRSLSFDTVFMLSVNEGTLPPGKRNHSFIPFELRKIYKLPTFNEQDALSAYYFFRLLQGAKNIYLFYNSEKGSKGEEKSRYIRQLEYYLTRANPRLKLHYRHYSLPLHSNTPKEILIQKDEKYFEKLIAKSLKSGLSPSFISSYFACSLQFLLKNIVQLRAPDEIDEDMDAAGMGTLYHDLMHFLYKPYMGKTVSAEIIAELKKTLPQKLENVLVETFKSQKEHMAGRNSLLIETVKVLAEKTLDQDLKYAPFKILHLEVWLRHDLQIDDSKTKKVALQGVIDRIDLKDNVIRVIDYKTGLVENSVFNYFDAYEDISQKNKEAFQTLFYAYLYRQKNASAQTFIQPNILPLKKVNDGYVIVNKNDGPLDDSHFESFEKKLKEIIAVIFDENEPVTQSEDRNICAYCDYTSFCLR